MLTILRVWFWLLNTTGGSNSRSRPPNPSAVSGPMLYKYSIPSFFKPTKQVQIDPRLNNGNSRRKFLPLPNLHALALFFFFFFSRKPRSTWGGSQRGARIQRLPAAPLAVKDVSACANSSSPPITACLGSPANRPAWKCLHVCALKGSWQSQMISHKVPKKDARIAPFFDDLSTTFPYQGCICHSLICRVCIRIIFLLFVFILVQDNT